MTTALIVIDVQNEYVTGALPVVFPPVEESLAQIARAMDAAAERGIPIVLMRHNEDPDAEMFVPGSEGWQLHELVADRPHSVVLDKRLPGSFTGTGLQSWLANRDIDRVALAGYMTHMCVDTTARQATHRGLEPVVLSDATGDIDLSEELPARLAHTVELAVLGDGLAEVSTTEEFIASLSERR